MFLLLIIIGMLYLVLGLLVFLVDSVYYRKHSNASDEPKKYMRIDILGCMVFWPVALAIILKEDLT